MNIEHISVSRESVFKECKLIYKYQYHLKIPSGVPEPFHFTYGKLIHKIAEEYVRNKGDRLLSEVAIDVLQGKIPLEIGVYAPMLPPEYKKRMPSHLRSIKTITEQIGMEGELEYSFRYDLDP